MRSPSTEVVFRLQAAPDSISIGDPVHLRLEASAPARGELQFPAFTDSIGPFAILSSMPAVRSEHEGRSTVVQEIDVTLWETGRRPIPLQEVLWIPAPGETLFATAGGEVVTVGSVLPPEAQGPEHLHDLKDVVPLGWSLWPWILLGLALLAALAYWWLRWRKRRPGPIVAAPPPLAPLEAFELGLGQLLSRELPQRGEMKQFYVELSQLLRAYVERKFGILALEGTRSEVVAALREEPRVSPADLAWLEEWLSAGDLVKFAKGERLVDDALQDAEHARTWVRQTDARPPQPAPPATPVPPVEAVS